MAVTVKKKTAPVAVETTVQEAQAIISKTMPDGSESSSSESLGHELIAGPIVKIEVSVGLTRNMGDYESIKFHVGITMPSAMDADEIEETYTSAKNWVDEKVNEMNAEIDAVIGNKT